MDGRRWDSEQVEEMTANKPARSPTSVAARVTALEAEVRQLRSDLDTMIWLFEEQMFKSRMSQYLAAIHKAGPELARQLASGQRPQLPAGGWGSAIKPPGQ